MSGTAASQVVQLVGQPPASPFNRAEHMRRVGLSNKGKKRPRDSFEGKHDFSLFRQLLEEYNGPDELTPEEVDILVRGSPLTIYDLIRLSAVLILRTEHLRDCLTAGRKMLDPIFVDRILGVESELNQRVRQHESLLKTQSAIEDQARRSLEGEYVSVVLDSVITVLRATLSKCPHCDGDISPLCSTVSSELRKLGRPTLQSVT